MVGNPADLALIRMQADGMLPAAERRGYTNVTRGRSMRSAEHTRFLVAKLQRLITGVKVPRQNGVILPLRPAQCTILSLLRASGVMIHG